MTTHSLKIVLSIIVVPLLLTIVSYIIYWGIDNNLNLDLVTILVLICVVCYLHIAERIIPLKVNWNGQKSEVRPDIYHFISLSIFSVVGNFVSISLTLRLHTIINIETKLWDSFNFLSVFVVANILGEFAPYWYHRISHSFSRSPAMGDFLWKVHSIHHIPHNLNWRKTNWMHPINTFLNTFLKFFPLLLLGFSKEVVFAVGITTITASYLSHANINARTGFLDYIFVTPHLHHFHHSVIRKEAKNFGNVLPFWDLVFGTYFNKREGVLEVGIHKDFADGYPDANQFVHQLQFPFIQPHKSEDL